MTPRACLLLPLLLLSLAACGPKAPQESAATNAPPVAAPTAKDPMPAAAAQTGAAPIGTLSSRGETVPGSSAAPAAEGGIDFDLPAAWTSEPPSSSMRLAQATIPGPGGPGQIAVFFFGPGGGGGVDANIKRWIDQTEPAPGAEPKPQTFQTDKGFKVTWIEVAGTIKPSTMGTGPSTAQPGSRLLGAVVEGPGGPWFFKATGPDATIAAARDPFVAMLKGVRPKK